MVVGDSHWVAAHLADAQEGIDRIGPRPESAISAAADPPEGESLRPRHGASGGGDKSSSISKDAAQMPTNDTDDEVQLQVRAGKARV